MTPRAAQQDPDTTSGLSSARIVGAAIELIRTEGSAGLSMRKLAARLDSAAMSLYRYFATKEELLSAVADRFVAEIDLPEPGLTWEERIVDYLTKVERLFQRHPELAHIAAGQHLNSVTAFRGVEIMLAALREAGLDDEHALSAWYALTFFTVGFAQRRAALHEDAENARPRLSRIKSLPCDEFEHFHAIASAYARGPSDEDFVAALKVTLAGVAAIGSAER